MTIFLINELKYAIVFAGTVAKGWFTLRKAL